MGVCATLSIVTAVLVYSHHQGWLGKGMALQQLHLEQSGSWHHQVHLWGTVQVYISSGSLDGGFQLWVDWCRTAGAVTVWLEGAPVDGICVGCGEHTAGIAVHGVCSIAAGSAGVGVAGATAVGSLATWVAGADVDAPGATSPMLDVSGLTTSRWLLKCGHEHICTYHHQLLGPGMSHYLLCRWWWQGATGSWCHWGQIQFGQQRMDISCGSLTCYGTLNFGQHVGWGGHIQQWLMGQCAWFAVGEWCIVLTGIAFLQVNTSEHQLAWYGVLVELSMCLDLSTWHRWAIFWQSSWLLQLDHCL